MRRLLFFLGLFALFCAALPMVSSAQRPSARLALDALAAEARIRVVSADTLLRFRTRAVPGGRVDVTDGVLRAAYRIGRRVPAAASPEETARTYLAAEASRFGWVDTADDLAVRSVQQGAYATHVTYQQMFFGLPVYNRLVKVNLNRDGQPAMVLSGYAPHLAAIRTFNPQPALSPEAAEARARQLVSARGARTAPPELVVYPSRRPRLAWRVVAWPNDAPAEWDVLLDAHTAEVIHLLDLSTHSHGAEDDAERARQTDLENKDDIFSSSPLFPLSPTPPLRTGVAGVGLVFDPDPLTTAGVEYAAPYVDANDADVQELNDQRIEVTLNDITQGMDGLYRLEGPFVMIDGAASIGGKASTPPAEADPNAFRYGRADDAFEAVMSYYHVDKSQRYLQSLNVGRDIQNGPIRINPHGFGNADDSRYFPNMNAIAFGDGGIDDGEDADVIWHEYGHALLQSSAPGLLNSPEGQALHEGWADYWAASYSRWQIESDLVPERDWRKVFTWDGNNGSWQGRRLDHPGRYPDDTRCDDGACGNQIYQDGLLWATTLMEVYDDLGREVIDRLNLASHGYLNPPSTFADAAEALIQADLDLNAGAHLGVLIEKLGNRGYVDPNTFGPLVEHEPIPHIEQVGGAVIVEVTALSVRAPVDRVDVVYSVNGAPFESLTLTFQGGDRYTGTLTLPPEATEVAYYFEALDAFGIRTWLPAGAPQETFRFGVGPDTEAPLVTHEPIERAALQAWPVDVTAGVVDNQGVDSVWVTYAVERSDGTPQAEGAFGLQRRDDQFIGTFPVPAADLDEGSRVRYLLHARDVAVNPNESVFPTSGPLSFEIVVEGVLATFNFETAQGAQSTGAWERGVPTYGVQVAHSGARVWATGLNTVYPAEEHLASLRLPTLNLNLDSLNQAFLIFWHWYDLEHSGIVTPDDFINGVLWDGGNVKASTNGGRTWTVLEPEGGYTGTIEAGTSNPLSGQPVFGGYSFGWRRVVVPLPLAADVRIRFDFGTDGSNELASLFYAGWYLDDVRIVVDRPQDVTPPSVAAGPDALMTAEAGRVPPPIVIQAHDNVGIDAVLAEYEIIPTSGTRRQDTLRLAMNTGNLTLFSGTIPAPAPFGVGDRIEYRLRLRDFDGNTTVYPGPGQPPLRIEYRLAERFSALGNARASGLWQRQDTRWTTSTEGLLEATSSLVLEPFDLPDNAEAITFTLTHSYRLGSELGGNLKLSLDEGTTWSLLDPEGSYSTPFAPVQAHPMSGEGVFTGPSPGTVETAFDLSDFGGRQVRLRLDFGAARAPDASERWIIEQAALAYTTGDTAFDIPRELALHPNFPDPFIDNTTLSYTLPERMPVRLELYNILGQRISVLVDGEQDAGTYTLTMGRGSLAGGVYILRMLAGSTQKIERMVISR